MARMAVRSSPLTQVTDRIGDSLSDAGDRQGNSEYRHVQNVSQYQYVPVSPKQFSRPLPSSPANSGTSPVVLRI